MPMRDDASYCRPRLYDGADPERPDDVALLMEALERAKLEAMERGDDERVWHATDLMKRIAEPAGQGYEAPTEAAGDPPAEAEP
jgi:hypothetical protein